MSLELLVSALLLFLVVLVFIKTMFLKSDQNIFDGHLRVVRQDIEKLKEKNNRIEKYLGIEWKYKEGYEKIQKQ